MRRTWWQRGANRKVNACRHVGRPSWRPHLELLEDRLAPATHTWNGSASNLWSNGTNWTGGSPAGDASAALVFPSGATNLANMNDIAGLTIQSITFSGNGYSITGSQGIMLSAGITADAGVTTTDALSLTTSLGAAQTITVTNGGATLTLGGIVSGAAAAGLTKAAMGELVLSAANTYAGGTTLTAGTLTVANNSALGSGTLALNAGTLQSNADTTLSNPFTVGGTATIGGSNNLTFSGAATGTLTSASNTLTISNTAMTSFGAPLTGLGALTVAAGVGTVLMQVPNTYSGTTTLTSGTLAVKVSNALGTGTLAINGGLLESLGAPPPSTVVLSNMFTVGGPAKIGGGANFTLSGSGTLSPAASTLTVANTATTAFSGILSGLGALTVDNGTGSLLLSSANTYAGGTTLTSGTVILGADSALGTGPLALNGGVLAASGSFSLANSFAVGGTAMIGGASDLTLRGSGSLGSGTTLTVTSTHTTTFSGVLSGAGALTVQRTLEVRPTSITTVILANANTFTGTTTVNGGVLVVDTNTALGAGNLVLDMAGTLQAGVNFLTLANPFTVGPDAVGAIAGSLGGNNTFVLSAPGTLNGTLTVSNIASTIGLTGTLTGSGGIVRDNQSGSLVLGAANTYTGSTVVSGGFLQAGIANALPANSALTVATGATLLLNNFDQTIASLAGAGMVSLGSGTLTLGNNTSTTFSGTISGVGGLVKVGTGTFTLAGTGSVLGPITINAGTLQLGAALSSGFSAVAIASGATFDLNNFNVLIGSLAGAGNVTLGSGSGATLSTGGNNSSTIFSGVISGNGAAPAPGAAANALNKSGTGTLTLGGANTYTGATLVSAGTLQLGKANVLPTTTNLSVDGGNATLDLNNFNATIGSLAGQGNVTLGSGTLTVAFDALGTVPPPVIYSGIISGTGGLTKAGTGLQILSGNNTYSGPTLVGAGELLVNGSQPASNVTVNSGAAFGGSGTVGTITTSGAILPASAQPVPPGILHSGNVTFSAGSLLTSFLNSATLGTGYSQLNAAGTVNLSASPTLTLVVGFSQPTGLPAVGTTFTIVTTTGGVTGTFAGQPDGSSITINGNVFQIRYAGNSVTLTLTTLASNNQRFVTQVYLDLLKRPVDPNGLTFWSGQLDRGASRNQVVLGIEGSQEYRTLLVQGFYQTYLHRAADPMGLSTFVAFLATGGTDEQVQSLITGSPEYFQTRGGGTNEGFLNAIYQDALNRAIDPNGHTTFLTALNNGATTASVATAIFSSTEYRQDLVQGFYLRFLHRGADAGGLTTWVNVLQGGGRDEDVIAGIVGSGEYFSRV